MSSSAQATAGAIVEDLHTEQAVSIDVDGVTVEFATADSCGALGCRRGEDLARVTIDGYGEKTVCPVHLDDLLAREVGA